MRALTFAHFGSPEVLNYTEVKYPEISKNEVLIENRAIGLNYADIYRRKGNYHLKGEPPYIAGYEGSGIIVDSKPEKHKIGDRVAYADVPPMLNLRPCMKTTLYLYQTISPLNWHHLYYYKDLQPII